MGKESFVMYKKFYKPVSGLSDEQLGRLFRVIFKYQIDGDVTVEKDIEIAFEFFKNQFDIDDIKYQAIVERNRNNGRKGGAPRKGLNGKPPGTTSTQGNPNNPVFFLEPKKADYDNDYDINNNIGESNDSPTSSFEVVWSSYGKKGNKKTSEKKWSKLTAAKKSKAIAYIPAYVNATPDKQYRKNFETFINQECWNDELPDFKQTNKQTSNETTNRNFV